MDRRRTSRVAIIGGGIGGLAVAIGVHRAGHEATVFEQARQPGGAGTALGLWPTALHALDQLGVGDQVRTRAARQRDAVFLRPDGSRLARLDTAAMQRRTGDPVYLLSRPALLAVLRSAVPPAAVRFGAPVDAAGVADLRADYDVVVAADGVFSTARAALFGTRCRASYLGMTAWRGVIDDLATDSFSETWGAGAKFGITAQEGGRTNWFAAVRAPERHQFPDGELAALTARFGDWHDRVRQVLDHLTEDRILRHDLYELDPPLPSYVTGNVALIGDAAHAMSPDLGRGACEALVDAATLTQGLATDSDPRDALAAYDRRRRRPTQRLAAMSRRANRFAQVRRFLPVRDAALRLALTVMGPPD